MKEFPSLVYLYHGNDFIWLAGAEWDTRSDGTSSLMVAQAYSSQKDYPEGTIFMDENMVRWELKHGIEEGFFIAGVILEEIEEDNSATK